MSNGRNFTFIINDDLKDVFRMVCKRNNRFMSQIIIELIENYVREQCDKAISSANDQYELFRPSSQLSSGQPASEWGELMDDDDLIPAIFHSDGREGYDHWERVWDS